LPNAAEAIGSSGRRVDEPANPVSRLDVADGLQLTHGATNRATRYAVLLDKGRLADQRLADHRLAAGEVIQ
jgi:hypothetical protein